MKLRISLFYLFFYLGMGAFLPFFSLFLHQRGFDSEQIGVLLAAGSLTGIVAQPAFGVLSDSTKDYRTPLKIAIILSSALIFGYFFGRGFLAILITTVLFNFLYTPVGPLMDAIAVEKGPRFGFSFGKVRLWGAFGYAFITVLAGYVFSALGYQYSCPTFAVIGLFLFILIFSFPSFERPKRQSVFSKDVLGSVFSNGRFVWFVVITLLITSCMTMNVSYLPIYFQKMAYPINLVGWNFTIAALVEVPLFWVSAKLIRRMGLFPFLALGTMAYAIKYFIMGMAPNVAVVLGVQALDGVAFAVYFSSAVEIVNLMAPLNAKATAQTIFGAASGVSGIIGNLLGGFVMQVQGPQFLFFMMTVMSGLAAVLFLLFPGRSFYRIEEAPVLDSLEAAEASS